MNRLRHAFSSLQLTDWLAVLLLLTYVIVFSTLTIRQHQSFNTNALDLAKFDQSIWNTSQGRPYEISVTENLVIESHFSPALAFFAPFYWLWPDIRILFILQSILLGGAGFLIYWYFRRSNSWLGLIVLAAYLMQPALHQVNLVEFRRLTLAVFATSFAVYHLLRKRYGLMAVGLALALLSKEDMSLTVIAFGLYITLIQREWKIGIVTLAIGVIWLVAIPFAVLPSIMTHNRSDEYQHAYYYSYLGSSIPEILRTIITNPGIIFTYAGQIERLQALFDLFWPTAFLFLLAPELAFFLVPHLGFLLASTSNRMGRLEAWYPSILIILLFWAVAIGVSRISGRWQKIALGFLIIFSAVAWINTSQLWPGKQFDIGQYQVSSHEYKVAELISNIPPNAVVMAQDPFVPHLSHREKIYLFPWTRQDDSPQFIVLDREMRTYPLNSDEYRSAFYDILASPNYKIVEQLDSFFILEQSGELIPQVSADETWDDALHLRGLDVAVSAPGEAYQSLPEELDAGSVLRVDLYWDVIAKMGQNYTVYVHALDARGNVLGQHDGWPADSHRPTSVLPVGDQVRDIHYLTLPHPIASDELTLRVGLYEGISGKILLNQVGQPDIQLQIP